MPLKIVRNDITKAKADAIVNSAKKTAPKRPSSSSPPTATKIPATSTPPNM